MNAIINIYRKISILSIDVAVGAMVCGTFFLKINSLNINFSTILTLGISVWIIYTADHLKDASRIKTEATSARHKFHQQHFKALFIAIILAGGLVIVMILNLDKFTLLWGLKLSILVILYLVINHYLSFTKEIVGGLLYCIGVLLPTISQADTPSAFLFRYEVLIFSLLVIINLLLFSGNELMEDRLDDHKSFALRFGKPATLIVVKSLISLVLIIIVLSWNHLEPPSQIIFTLMTLTLISITTFPKIFEKNNRYRYWGDLIFLFPVIALIT